MKLIQYKSTSTTPISKGFAGIAAKLTFTVLATAYAATVLAGASTSDTNTAYVDSIHQWGAWELDIEPAAGGLQQPSTQALNARNTKVSLRTNSITALSPATRAIPATPASPGITPAIPATPVTPPRGGPADGLF